MADDNFWILLERLAAKLRVDQQVTLDVKMDDVLADLASCAPTMRKDLRQTLALVIARLAILQIRLPPNPVGE